MGLRFFFVFDPHLRYLLVTGILPSTPLGTISMTLLASAINDNVKRPEQSVG